ncbi:MULTISPECIES: hypothetical protein [Pseudomonas]
MTIQRLKPALVAAAEGCVRQLLQETGFQFSADEKKPAEAGFSQDHIDSLSAAILAMVDHP